MAGEEMDWGTLRSDLACFLSAFLCILRLNLSKDGKVARKLSSAWVVLFSSELTRSIESK
ncbi:hypothetical protein BpHYR1_042463 [Brachionus plicatilis]|uniref:Uncharacterized protein n=1 Tax=Brachionus plicatilis TaxID=10195 RepID=A0A3M7S674_BRAPC|nr:hypothetical protein BpHYR1_042463 [Brachionus plicatilis]